LARSKKAKAAPPPPSDPPHTPPPDVRTTEGGDTTPKKPGDLDALSRLKHLIFGHPRDLDDPKVFHKVSLMAFLAWVGLGSDGLSSSCYGPDEAFRALQGHTYLAIHLALLTAVTVGLISFAYGLLIEHFPSGGGGYLVSTKLLGPRVGVVSGSALVVDYVLTITVSVCSGVDALFSLMPISYQPFKMGASLVVLAGLLVLNLRGVRESVTILLPIFLVFVAAHFLLITYGILGHLGALPRVLHQSHIQMAQDGSSLGWVALLLIFLRAYSLGGGTYTGIEAVSNGIPILREPKVPTAKRTMVLMATSLAFTAGGILFCYLLWDASPEAGKTMNAVLLDRVFGSWSLWGFPVGTWLVVLTLISEGALLFVAAQTGFLDGPRVLSNMAVDSWVPHRFAQLSERLVTKHGILLMGVSSGVLIIYTGGKVSFLVVLYSINVFLTFSLSQMGMSRYWLGEGKGKSPRWRRNLAVHLATLVLCLSILIVTTVEKFREGGWLTIVITASLVGLCMLIQSHYAGVRREIGQLNTILESLPQPEKMEGGDAIERGQPVAGLLVSGYGGLGIHSVLSVQRLFPGYYKDILFLSLGVVDSGKFKGADELEALKRKTEADLQRYVDFARSLGLNAEYQYTLGTDVVEAAQELCGEAAKKWPQVVFYLGKLVFAKERLFHRILHNDTAYAIQRRLQFDGLQTVVLPIRIKN
jgi:amino acid transporter